jgi:hypothetical protein
MLSEVLLRYKDIYAGTADIVCGFDKIESGLVFDEATHTYTYNGVELESVTRMIDSSSSYEYVPESVLKRAASRGTEIHKQIEMYIKDGIESDSYEFRCFLELLNKPSDIFKGKCVIDIKTYNTPTQKNIDKAEEQTALYRKALCYLTGVEEKEVKRYVIVLPKEPKKPKVYMFDD